MKKLATVALFATSLIGADSRDHLNRTVRVENQASSTVRYFFASNVERSTWEEDILGRQVLRPGFYINVKVDDGSGHCLYDLRAVLADGRERVTRRFNVCTRGAWVVTD